MMNLPASNPANLFSNASIPGTGMPDAAAMTLTSRQQAAFSPFLRYAAPTPTPKKGEFYWNEFKANYSKSRRRSGERYKETIKYDRKERWKLIMLSMASGLGFTAFRNLKRTFSYVFMMGMLTYPLMEANRTFPKIREAYTQVHLGNPTKGREMFREAMDDSIYSIFQSFFKPLTLGYVISLLLSLPSTMAGHNNNVLQNIIRFVLKKARVKLESRPMKGMEKLEFSIVKAGNTVSNRLLKHVPGIQRLEKD